MQYDVIIIGSGLAGLAAGAKLSKSGKKVLIIEQHNIVGGCATTFKRKEYTFEVSLHELNGLAKTEQLYNLYQDLGALENLTFLKIPEFYRLIGADIDIVIPDDADQLKNILLKKFPYEKKGILQYFKVIKNIHDEAFRLPKNDVIQKILTPLFPLLYRNVVFNMRKSVGEFLDSIIEDQTLKLILLGNLIYYHDDPYSMSMIFFSVAQSSFFSGSHYIQGGSQKLANYIAGIITSNGGEVLTRHLVTKIITENGTATGVEYKLNKKTVLETQKAFAKYIIANSAVPNVVKELLPEEKVIKIKKDIETLCLSPSLLNVYIGFKTTLAKYGVKHYSTIILDESCKTPKNIHPNFKGDFSKRNFIFVDYGQIDSKLAPEDKTVGSICTSDYLSDWENLSDDAYKIKKNEVGEILIERLNKIYPGIKDAVDRYEIGTAKTIKRYTMNPGGSVYGFAQIPNQAGKNRFSHESEIENLFFASAWTQPGGGFGAALGSGYKDAKYLRK